MKKLNTARSATKINNCLGLCAITFLAFSINDALAAVNCPPGHYPNSSGGCSTGDGYTPTDQGSIAQQHLDVYHQNKSSFGHYQQQWEQFNKDNLQLIEKLNKPLIRQYQVLAARLAKWHREDTKTFVDYFKQVRTTIPLDLVTDIPNDLTTDTHRNFMMGFITDAYIEKRNDFLIGQYNANLRNIAGLYFHMNPTVMKSISIDYRAKAYSPATSGKWGFTKAYNDSMSLRDATALYPFIRNADHSDYDFSQTEEHFSDRWNNANTSPSTSTSKTTRYYKFVPQPLPKSFDQSLGAPIEQRIFNEVNQETLAQTRANVVGFKFNRLMNTYLGANKNKEALLQRSVAQALVFPDTESITQITRVTNQAKNTCLIPEDSRKQAGKIDLQHNVRANDCNSGKRAMDWYVIENDDKSIQLKNTFSSQCLTTPRQAYEVPMTLVCGGRVNTFTQASQFWQWTGDQRLRRPGIDHLYSLTLFEPSPNDYIPSEIKTLDIFPYNRLAKKEADRAKWSINTGYMRSDLLSPQRYKSAHQLMQNFFALMYGFTEELPVMDRMKTVNAGSSLPVEDLNSTLLSDIYTSQEKATTFFNQLYANHALYNELPTSLKNFTTALRSGTSLLDAYSQYALAIYDDVRKTYTFKPTYWNDPSNRKGDVVVYENPRTNSVDVFISLFDGNPASGNRYFPTDRRSNSNWTYVTSLSSKDGVRAVLDSASSHFAGMGTPANYGDVFRYNNPISKKLEFFQATFKGITNNAATPFPTNQTSNDKWRYLGQNTNAVALIAALANDMNTAHVTYLYNLIKLNVGSSHAIPNIEQRVNYLNGDQIAGVDVIGVGDSSGSGSDPAYDIAGQPSLGQYFYVSSPTITGSSFNSGSSAALGAIANAVITTIPNRFNPAWSDQLLQRALMRQQFEEMLNPRYNDILGELGLDPIDKSPDELFQYPVSPRFVYEEWSEGRLNPPEDFSEFSSNFRNLFRQGAEGDIELNNYLETQLDDALPISPTTQGLLAVSNSSLSSAFNALTVSESSIALSVVTVNSLLSTFVGLSF
jgi:hypothetical protein